jgi:hypothetical protein
VCALQLLVPELLGLRRQGADPMTNKNCTCGLPLGHDDSGTACAFNTPSRGGDNEQRKLCPDCARPVATQRDWDTIPEGQGDHLCWGQETQACADATADTIASLRAEMLYWRDLYDRQTASEDGPRNVVETIDSLRAAQAQSEKAMAAAMATYRAALTKAEAKLIEQSKLFDETEKRRQLIAEWYGPKFDSKERIECIEKAEAKLAKATEALEMVRGVVAFAGTPQERAAFDPALAAIREVALEGQLSKTLGATVLIGPDALTVRFRCAQIREQWFDRVSSTGSFGAGTDWPTMIADIRWLLDTVKAYRRAGA